MIRTIRGAIAPSIAGIAFAAALALPATGAADATASTACGGKPAKVTKLKAINTKCPDAVATAKAWGKRAPSPCIQGHFEGTKQIDRCTVRKYKCVGHWKYADPSDPGREFIKYSTSCRKGEKRVTFDALVTRASQ